MMTQATTRICAVAALTFVLTGCQTTGDPRQGGLFGWSEEKATERQAALKRQDAETKRAESEAKLRATELGERQAKLQDAAASSQRELNQLLDENGQLERQLAELIGKRRLSETELARLKQVLASNQRARQSVQRLAAQASGSARAAAPAPAPVVHTAAAQVNEQNAQLQREVMLLLLRR